MERQLAALVRLVDDLLDVSRITRGKVQLRPEPVELAEVVARAVETSTPLIQSRRHELKVSLPPGPVRLTADPTRLAQVLANLLNNAAKYTEEGGRIRLTAERQGGDAVVRVRDTGIGIPADVLPRVFELFAQADRSLDRAQGGLGIGLTLVKSLVEMHGGGVQARSEGLGRGSEFVVRLPAPAIAAAPEPKGGRKPTEVGWPRRRILVVDDNVDSTNALAKMLTRLYSQEVRVAHDGPEALAAAGEFRPEIVLLDIGLPGMDGYEVARRLRSRPKAEGLLLVALTGWGQESDRDRAREAGFDRHLVKPVDPETLRDLLSLSKPISYGH
jgi:CheY-like chemotaxis protein